MNEKRQTNTHNDADIRSDMPADDASIRTIASADKPRSWDILQQFFESIPIKASDFRNFARFAPLVSAVLAPISTLLDIPALTVS
jgi:hypothetical protein